jgi:hypothetical protein
LPAGVRVDFWSEGSTRNINPKKYYFVAVKVDKRRGTLSYGATIYQQTRKNGRNDAMDERAHFRTALYRLENFPVVVEGVDDALLENREEEWLNEVRCFIGGLLFTVGCFDVPAVQGDRLALPPVATRYRYDQATQSVVALDQPKFATNDADLSSASASHVPDGSIPDPIDDEIQNLQAILKDAQKRMALLLKAKVKARVGSEPPSPSNVDAEEVASEVTGDEVDQDQQEDDHESVEDDQEDQDEDDQGQEDQDEDDQGQEDQEADNVPDASSDDGQ